MWDNLKMKRMFLKNGVFICGLALALGFLYLYGCGEGGGEGNSDISSPETPLSESAPDNQLGSKSLTTNPDLVVASPSVSDSGPIVGTSFTLSVTVHNDGDGASGVTTLRYYRSTDTTISTSDTEVGTDTVTGLTALGSASGSVELAAQSTPGTYYYGACVDAVEEESDTTNNCSSPVEVKVLGSQDQSQGNPDLVVISPSVSDSGPTAGTNFTLSATVRNDGDGASEATTLRYYRSTDTTISTSDTEIGTDAVVGIGVSGSTSKSVEVTAQPTPGTYYYGACVDAVEEESDETNNCSSSVQIDVPEPEDQLQGSPDLTILAVSVATSPDGTYPGGSFTFSATVRNDGDGASEATTLRYYQSTDATITTSDTEVGSDAVAGLGDLGDTSESVDLTAPSNPGTYYYGACVDTVEDESDTTNNCSSSVQINVLESQNPPNLVVGSPSVSDSTPDAEAMFTLSATVRNNGNGASEATTLRYYRSTDATITSLDTEVDTDAVAELDASESTSESVGLTAPSDPGTYYYGACVDAVEDESDTTNNCSPFVQVNVRGYPDLAVGSPSVSDSNPTAGTTLTLSATVRNDGNRASVATTLRYYQSTDSTITMSDTAVGTDAVGALAAAGTSVQSISLTVPATAGAYYYGACVDAVADESDTADNCSASVKVDVQTPQPSTRSVEVTAPQEWAPVGGTVTYAASVLDENGDEMSGYAFSWTSSDTSKATVDASGVVTAHAVGEVTIIATASATASATVKARPFARDFGTAASNSQSTLSGSLKMDVVKPVARIELSPSSLSFTEVGGDWETVTATLYDADNNEMTPTYWGWYSGDREVADVYSRVFGSVVSASVQSIGEGATTVTLSANGTTGSMNVTVTLPTARVNISPRSLTFEALGDTKSVTVWVLDENGDEDEDATFGYIGVFSPCCDPFLADPPKSIDIEEVDGGLEITAEGPGRGSYTISSPDVESAILLVTVYQNPATLEVSPSTASLEVDGTTTLSATIKDANGHSMHVDDGMGGLVVYWETSDSAVATVEGATATTDDNTGGSATVTAVAAGMATITGRWGSRSRGVIGTTTVTVTDSN